MDECCFVRFLACEEHVFTKEFLSTIHLLQTPIDFFRLSQGLQYCLGAHPLYDSVLREAILSWIPSSLMPVPEGTTYVHATHSTQHARVNFAVSETIAYRRRRWTRKVLYMTGF
jgi:hypothetical protein